MLRFEYGPEYGLSGWMFYAHLGKKSAITCGLFYKCKSGQIGW